MHRSIRFAVVFLCVFSFHFNRVLAQTGSVPAGACLYALDSSASRAFQIAGAQSVTSACGLVVESSASDGFEMEGSETLYLQNHAQVSVVGGAQLNGQTYLRDSISNTQVQAVRVTSPGDPLASVAAPSTGTVVSSSHAQFDMNSRPTNNTLQPGVYCGGLTIGNTNGTTFTMNPGVYIMAGGGLVLNSQAVVTGTGVTIYNTSSTGWGCSSSYSYTPVTVSGQVTAHLSAPTSGSFNGILLFGDRTGCVSVGSCQDQINGGSTAILNGALYFKSDQIIITGSNASGYTMLVADKIYINGNSVFGITGDPYDGISVSLTPATSSLYASQTRQFTASASGTNSTVTWSISPAGAGTISSTGLYTAPSSISAQQTVTVTATSQADTTKSNSATVTLLPPAPPVTVNVVPAAATLYGGQSQQLTATVSNTGNTSVTWIIAPANLGSISAGGLYTAPSTIATQQVVTVTATSQADTSKSASATLTLMPAVTVSLSPAAVTLYGGGTQQFSATVGNTSNTSVAWTLSGGGTISSAGLYTAPAAVATAQTVTVTATSQFDPTKSSTSTISLSPPVAVTVTPISVTLYGGDTQQFAATVGNASNTAITWTISGAGNISSAGLYTAPAAISTAQTVTITATSQFDSTKFATATVTLSPPVAVTVKPAAATLYAGQTLQFTSSVANASNTGVTWTVSGGGSITSAGLYSSPASVATTQTVIVTATSQADQNRSATATVTLYPPVVVNVSPIAAGLTAGQTQQFTASVTNDVTPSGITWTVVPAGIGTVAANGLYTAPAVVPAQQNVTIVATSQTDTTRSGSATVTLNPLTIGITPPTVSLGAGQTQQFAASITGNSNTAVTWQITPAGMGAISASGLYTAPSGITAQQSVTVTATSHADTSKSASATVTLPSQCTSNAYGYRRIITVDHTKVSNTDLTDFPMLVSGTYSFLAGTANGGKVQSTNGYDIVFTSDSAGQNLLDFEIDNYDPISGKASFWVRMPTLHSTADTSIYMWYGNPAITASQENKAGVWRNNYRSVYHLGGSTVSASDSGPSGYALSGSAVPVGGVIGGGAAVNGNSGSYLYHDSVTSYPSGSSAITLEGWIQLPAGSSATDIFGYGANSFNGSRIAIYAGSQSYGMEFENLGLNLVASPGSTWHHVVGIYGGDGLNSTTSFLYVDGALVPSTTGGGSPNVTTDEFKIGGIATVNFCCGFNGSVDEVRVSSGVRSSDWIATQYSNESSPSTFYGLSEENSRVVPGAVTLYGSQSQQFSELPLNSCPSSVTWSASPTGFGSIDSTTGLYIAPATITAVQTVQITATNTASVTQAGTAVITLAPFMRVTPATVTLNNGGQTQQFTAIVAINNNPAITWTISPAGAGSISPTGLYTAPASITSQQVVTVTATLQTDPTKSASAQISLSPIGLTTIPASPIQCASTGYGAQRTIVIDHTKIPSDLTNFPFLFSSIDSAFATTANGGRVANFNGDDIIFSLDPNGLTKLDHELQQYDPVTGQIVAWIRIPTLSHSTDTVVYVFYGNYSVAAPQQNPSGVWDSNYTGVYHLVNAGMGVIADSTSNNNNGTGSHISPNPGVTGQGATFDGTSSYMTIPPADFAAYPTSSTPSSPFAATFETWFKTTSGGTILEQDSGGSTPGGAAPSGWVSAINLDSSGHMTATFFGSNAFSFPIRPGTAYNDNQWHRMSITVVNLIETLYVDGQAVGGWNMGYPFGGEVGWAPNYNYFLGTSPSWSFFNGALDEVNVSKVARSSDWIATEYRNQSSPSTFYKLYQGTSDSVAITPPSVSLYASQSQQFTTPITGACHAASVVWSMPSGSPGTLTQNGLYLAPASIDTAQTVAITAATLGNTSRPITATVTLVPRVSVSVTPYSATLTDGQVQQLTANVANSSNSVVTWSLKSGSVGSISATGLYSAPADVTAQQTVVVTATSQADPAQSASATITLTPASVTPTAPGPVQCGANGYSLQRTIIIDHTKVQNTDQSNFPFLFDTTDLDLASTTNGGHVTSPTGDDIIFSTDPNGLTKLDHELEQYDPLTGHVIAWIRIPTLLHTADTIIYVFYGNPNVLGPQQNPQGVWDTNYQAVYHLANVGVGSVPDSTVYGNNASPASLALAPGQVAGAAALNGSSSFLAIPQADFPNFPTGIYDNLGIPAPGTTSFSATFGVWFKTASPGGILGQVPGQSCVYVFGFCVTMTSTQPGYNDPFGWASMMYINTDGQVVASGVTTSAAYNDNKWHYAVLTFADTSTNTLYVDGQNVGSAKQDRDSIGYSPSYNYFVGTGYTLLTDLGNWDWLYFNGSIDEVSISNTVRSADWVRTQYNSQSSPSTFYKFYPLGAVQVVPPAASLYASQGQQFAVAGVCNASVTWTMPPAAQGSLTASGFYTAPAAITASQAVTVTASDRTNGSTLGSAVVTFLAAPAPLSLVAAAPAPYAAGTSQTWTATLKDQFGSPEPGMVVTFNVSGANQNIGGVLTDVNGVASYSYSGANPGSDTIRANAVVKGRQLASSVLTATWVVASPPSIAASVALIPQPILGRGGLIGAFTDSTGAVIEPIAVGASAKTFIVPPGATQLQLGIDDEYYKDNGGPGFVVNVSGVPVNIPSNAMPWKWSHGGLNNRYQFGLSDGSDPVIAATALTPGQSVSIAYQSGTISTNIYLRPLVNADGDQTWITGSAVSGGTYFPTLYTTASSYPQAQPITLSALVTNTDGSPASNVPVGLYITGANPGQYQATTDTAGIATFLYSGTNAGTDSLQAQALPPGQASLTSNQSSVTWTNSPTPPTAGSLSLSLFGFVGRGQVYTVLATDASGVPVSHASVGLYVSGVDSFQLSATTDETGHAAFNYFHTNPGPFSISAVDTINGNIAVSNTINGVWTVPSSTSTGNSDTINVSISAQNEVVLPNTLQVNGVVTDSVGIIPTVSWSLVSGPGMVTFADPSQAVTTATFAQPGTYVLQLSATDTGASAAAQFTVTVDPVPIPEVPQGWVGRPIYGSQVSGIVPIALAPGVTLSSGVLVYYPGSDRTKAVVLNPRVSGAGQIGSLDTTLLPNGAYSVELHATDPNGQSQYSLVIFTVVGNYKPGRVTTAVTDLVVPATGLAINIRRQYDSLNAAKSSDFGNGWSLSTTVDLQVDSQNNVTFTLGGQRHTFYFTPQYFGTAFFQFGTYAVAYTPESGLRGKLEDSGEGCPFDYVQPDGAIWLCVGGDIYSPPGYVYTDPFGTRYTMGADGTLQSIKDIAGNTLTVSAGGIASSTGRSVPFVRDASGRITQITDTMGNKYLYGYDADGNLATVTYPTLPQPSSYTYDATHHYLSGIDFRGNPLPTTTYDPSGRLQSVTDALGNKTNYAYDLTTNTTTITYPPDASGAVGTAVMTYDALGNMLTSTDPLGHTTTNVYDGKSNLLSVTDSLGHTNSYTFDSNGNRTSSTYPQTAPGVNTTSTTVYNQYSQTISTTDELGNARTVNYDANFMPQSVTDVINGAPATLASFIFNADSTLQAGAIGYDIGARPDRASQYTYDAYGSMTSQTDALGRVTSYGYDALGHQTSMTMPLPTPTTSVAAATTTYQYDAFGHLSQTAAPLGRTTSSQFDANGNKLSDADARGNVTTYQYDSLNRLTTTTYPTQPATTTSKTYDFRGNVIDETDQAGHVVHHVYDLAGRLTSITQGFGTSTASTTAFAYYDDGEKRSETDALGHTTTYTYDAAGRLTVVAGVKGNATYGYNAAGNRTSSTDGDGNTTQFQYDARKRLVKTIYPDATAVTNGYDEAGNLIGVTDQAGHVVQYNFDAANQLQSVVQLAHPTLSHNRNIYGYDAEGNLSSLTDENGHTTQSSFDLLSNLTSKVLPDGSLTETRSYDTAGNVVSLQHFNGTTTTYGYDPLNRLTSRAPDASYGEPTVTFTYTGTGKRASMTDGTGTTTYAYDSLDRLTTKATPEGTLSYTYDAASNLASMSSSNANGVSTSYTYDSLNRLSTVVDNRLPAGQNTTTYSYDAANNVVTATYPNGVQSVSHYDQLNRLTALTTPNSGYLYQLGPTGNRTSVVDLNGRTVTWTYDGINRLMSEAVSQDPAGENGAVTYGLDPVGNRLSTSSTQQGISSGTLSFNLNDWLSVETYDANGNTIASRGKTFAYDSENRLRSMNGSSVTIQYDGDGNRVTETANGVTTDYLVDDLNPTGHGQVVEEVSSGAPQRVYTYGLQRISQNLIANGTWVPSFFGYDGRGNVHQLINSAGVVTDTYNYDAFGNLLNSSGTTPNRYLYRAEQYDQNLGLYYLRARYYNPTTGRFLTRDLFEGYIDYPATLHKYLYTGGDPVNWADPSGRDFLEVETIDEDVSTAEDAELAALEKRAECVLNTAADLLDVINTGDPGSVVSLIVDLSACKAALKKVHDKVGRLPKGEPGKKGSPQAGTTKKGYRMDPGHPRAAPGDAEAGPHFNWWDYTGGKRGSGGSSGAFPIE